MKAILKITREKEYHPPQMPNFLIPVNNKEDEKLFIGDLSQDQALEVAETMKKEFMNHWLAKRAAKSGGGVSASIN